MYGNDLSVLIGKTMISVENRKSEELIFTTTEEKSMNSIIAQTDVLLAE